MQVKNVIQRLTQMMPFMSEKEKKLGEFILENKHEVLSMTLKEISAKGQASEATVIRFVRKLGCEGYADFKLALSADLSASTKNEKSDLILKTILPTDTPDTVLKKISAFAVTSIQSTVGTVDPKELNLAIQLVKQTHHGHHRIYVSGMGASSTLAKQLVIKFMRLDIPVIYHEDAHIQLEAMTNITEDDLLICITTLGRSVQSHDYVDIANRKNAKVILITQFGNIELAKKATATLYVAAVENNFRFASQTALIVQSLIIDTLFMSLALEEMEELQEKIEEKNQIFEDLRYITNDFR